MHSTKVKICGLNTPDTMTAALEAGADFVGLVFYAASPRNLDIAVAAYLSSYVPMQVLVTGLFVNPDDKFIETIANAVRLDCIQLHGQETPARVEDIQRKFGKPVIKSIPISSRDDVKRANDHAGADWLLFDAQGQDGQSGGNGVPFNWRILEDFQSPRPWMLAGGLTPENVTDAVRLLRPNAVDVSSGVESSRGVKDSDKIKRFIAAAKAA